jgi:undecaprenyl pyrophosphate phosphatase UppP
MKFIAIICFGIATIDAFLNFIREKTYESVANYIGALAWMIAMFFSYIWFLDKILF